MERKETCLLLLRAPSSFFKVLWTLNSQAPWYGFISRQKERSQGEPCPQNTAQHKIRGPLDVGAQHVWSPMLCCIGMKAGDLWRASYMHEPG